MDIETFYCKPPIVSNIVSTQDFFVTDKTREKAIHAMKDETLQVTLTGEGIFFNEIPLPPFLIGKKIQSSRCLFAMRGNKY